jgi:hypothetical protein
MPLRSRAIALSLLPCALLPTACGSSFQAVKPQVDASLLLPCEDPMVASEESNDNELAAERLRVAKAYLDCKAQHGALVERVK